MTSLVSRIGRWAPSWWAWTLAAMLAVAGIAIALVTHDHRLASRSAFVLLACLVLSIAVDRP